MTNICIVNQSTEISNTDAAAMAHACASQVKLHAAPHWGLLPVPVTYLGSGSGAVSLAPAGSWVISLLDDPDQADALGWHTEDSGDLIYGRVFARPVLDNGGDALTKQLSVASVLSHEVLETLVDPHCNTWSDSGSGYAVATEVCDPVESDSYAINYRGRAITVSNFVTPHWFDPNAAPGETLDYLHKVSKPFQMSKGGYIVVMKEGKVSQQFGEHYPAWRKATKKVDTARAARR